jgi:tetraacyldisaccharide 4'-kinase
MKKNRVLRDTSFIKGALGILLKPLTLLYSIGVGVRNFLYDRTLLSSRVTNQYSIVVGNLTVGGTGKTPMIEFLIQLLKEGNQLVTLSRGYGRQTQGFRLASPLSTAEEIGDEPLQYYEKFGNSCPVAVCENRIKGANHLLELFPDRRLLLLDDAFQHRKLRPNLAILLNDYTRPFYKDEPFPGGRLRESRRGAFRADAIVTTKCPDNLSRNEKEKITRSIRKYASSDTPVFFSKVKYGELRSFDNTPLSGGGVSLVAGIARPEPLIAYVREKFSLSRVKLFPDHHAYTLADVEAMIKWTKNEDLILTTEKDKVKLRPLALKAGMLHKFAYLPIQVDFGPEAGQFEEWLRQQIRIPSLKDGEPD